MQILWHHGSVDGSVQQANPSVRIEDPDSSANKKITILLMDDENRFRADLAEYLECEGFRVIQATDGQDALDKLAGEKVDIIISDTTNSIGMGGVEFAKKRPLEIPFILISSHFPDGLNESELNLSAKISKGSPEVLVDNIRRILQVT